MSLGTDLIEKYGYRFIEIKSKFDEKIARYEKNEDGLWIHAYFDEPQARYHYKYSANNKDMGLQLAKTEWVIVDSETNEIISRETLFKRYPGWVTGLWDRLWGVYPTICSRPLDDTEKKTLTGSVYYHTFTPLKNSN